MSVWVLQSLATSVRSVAIVRRGRRCAKAPPEIAFGRSGDTAELLARRTVNAIERTLQSAMAPARPSDSG